MAISTAKTFCSCGCLEVHKIARRETADGKRVDLWSDGAVTSGMGFALRGVGVARSSFEAERDVAAGWLAFERVELYDGADVARLVRCARRAVRQRYADPREALAHYLAGDILKTVKAGKAYRWEAARLIE